MSRARLWRLISPTAILLAAGVVGGLQILLFPVVNSNITIQALTEGAFLLVMIVGLYLIPTARELTELSSGDAEAVYPPLLLGLGLFVIRGVTDVLDEFLAHPMPTLTVLEDGTMIAGFGLLLLGLVRWSRVQERQDQVLAERERRLLRKNEQLDSFVSVVSHDLRNPLAVAQGRLELIREDQESEDLDVIARAHERMNVLIEDLLTLAREGETVRDVEQVNLDALARECWETVDSADARLDANSGLVVEADRSRLKQLIENLIRNAIEHGGEDVIITLGDLGSGFYVEDDGPGIQAEIRDGVLSAGFTTTQEGTGYGLNIVKEVADAHGWGIKIEDGSEGGARFEFTGIESIRDR